MALTTALAAILAKINGGEVSKMDALKEILDLVFESGVPAGFLAPYLTEKGREYGELAADLAEFAKLEVQRMKAAGLE
jgi:hypothetical protein